jgi:hypothetical protein
MTQTERTVHTPRRRLGAAIALVFAIATTILVAACGGGGSGSGSTVAPGETMGPETPAATGAGY